MKKLSLFYFLFFGIPLFAQTTLLPQKKDSLFVLIQAYKKTEDTVLIKKALKIVKLSKNDSLIREINIDYGIQSYFKKDIRNLKKSEKNLYKIYKRNKDSFALAKHYHYKALYYKLNFKTDSCFYYFHQSKNISILLKDSLEVARRLLTMARIQVKEGDVFGSEITTVQGLRFIEPLKEKLYTSYLYNNLGVVINKMGRYKESREYYRKSYEIGQKGISTSKKELIALDFYNNTAISYTNQRKYQKAIEYHKKCFTIDSIITKYPKRYAEAIEGIGNCYYSLKNFDLALTHYLRSLAVREKINEDDGFGTIHTLLTRAYRKKKNYKKLKKHTLKALNYAKKTNSSSKILENYWYLSEIEKGEKGKAYLWKYILFNDSLRKKEWLLKNQFANVRYETEKKEIENASLKIENEKIELEIESEKQQKIIGWLFAGTSLLFIAFGYAVVANRRKKLIYKAKLEQVEIREKERQQIAKSLHDEVAGDIRILHRKLTQNNLIEESKELDRVKENVRTLSHQLSSISFDEVSFKDQIINLISDYFDADFFIKVKEIHSVQWKEVNNSIKRTLFISIRESIQNIEKYAAANNVVLNFSETKKAVSLRIKDDGKGFDMDKKKKGIGLKNMKERVEEINGIFSIKSELEKGTIIEIQIPKNGK